MPYTEMEYITLATLPPISTGSKGMLQYSWQGPSEWHGWCLYTVARWVSFAEEPDEWKSSSPVPRGA